MPTPSGPRSGKHGYAYTINGIKHMKNWSLNWNQALETRYHSESRGGPERFYGVEDWSGTIEGFGGNPLIFPGDEIALELFTGPSTGVYGAVGETYKGNAIVDQLTINWNWQPNQSLNWSVNFSADGCLSEAEDEEYDLSTTCDTSMCNLSLTYQDECIAGSAGTGVEGLWTTWNNVESAVLTITAANQAVVNSSTACCTQRVPGNIDFNLAVVDQEEYPILDFNTYYNLRLYTTAALYWQLRFGLLQDITNIRVDRESGAIVNKTNTLQMTGRICCGTDPAQHGSIITPASRLAWPIAAV
jgi:hypothetical protein